MDWPPGGQRVGRSSKLWPNRAGRVAIASLALFVIAGIAGAFVMLC